VDVDDFWALAFMLRCPELDVRLIISENGDTEHGAALIARLLEIADRTDIPIGIGIPLGATPHPHADWLGDYRIDDYPGTVLTDGVGALIDTIDDADERVDVVAIGPLVNLAAALARAPHITESSRFVGMHGSVYKGYLDSDEPDPEYNVACHPKAAQAVFRADWSHTITPLDTCGTVALNADRFRQIRASTDPLIEAVVANHDLWCSNSELASHLELDPATETSTLYDTVAIYLAFAEDLLAMETLPLVVDDKGRTNIDPDGSNIRCATAWSDLDGFYDLLTERLCGQDSP
jgi:inosine-uridine nucleoside N-ribohydrolase